MKRLRRGSGFFLGVLWLLITDVATAGDYTVVMGKAAAVCQHMLNLFNEDMKNFGELKYDQHEEFTAIEWTLAKESYCSRDQLAQFDIDNDGHEDIVLKDESCIRGHPSDSLFLYAEGKNAPQPPPHFTFDASVAKQASGVIGQFPHGTYDLRKLRKFREGTAEFYYYIGFPFKMHPFIYENRRYISIDNPFQPPRERKRRFTVIATTDNNGHLTDQCYFATQTYRKVDPDAAY